jgi:hypothetical protein
MIFIMTLAEDRLVLHDLKGVSLKVGFFLGTREEWIRDAKCISYSICWESVDVRVDQLTVSEEIAELDFYFETHQLIIDDHVIAGEVLNFQTEKDTDGVIVASCMVLLGKDY